MKKITLHDMNGINIIAVDSEAFDWGLEEEDFKAMHLIIKNDPEMKKSFIGNIQKHLTQCFSEFIGRQVTLKEINEAIETGWIE